MACTGSFLKELRRIRVKIYTASASISLNWPTANLWLPYRSGGRAGDCPSISLSLSIKDFCYPTGVLRTSRGRAGQYSMKRIRYDGLYRIISEGVAPNPSESAGHPPRLV